MAGDNFWDKREAAQKVVEECARLRRRIEPFRSAEKQLADLIGMVELGQEEDDETQSLLSVEIKADTEQLITTLDALELQAMLSDPLDKNNCILSINAGAGGTESCDWAEMLLRMYKRWSERREWKVEIQDLMPGEVAGIKSATLMISGENANGFCKAERGVHRLVRISPFDANKRRHTSFASVDVIAEIEAEGDIELDPSELRIDTYRAGGKGGQHQNVTESGVRLTHLPTGVVASSRRRRSQPANKRVALLSLRTKLRARQRRQKRRIPTSVPRRTLERRRRANQQRSSRKNSRKTPNPDDD